MVSCFLIHFMLICTIWSHSLLLLLLWSVSPKYKGANWCGNRHLFVWGRHFTAFRSLFTSPFFVANETVNSKCRNEVTISREQGLSSPILLSFSLLSCSPPWQPLFFSIPPCEPCRAKGQSRAWERKSPSFFFFLSLRQHNSIALKTAVFSAYKPCLFLRRSLQAGSHGMHEIGCQGFTLAAEKQE